MVEPDKTDNAPEPAELEGKKVDESWKEEARREKESAGRADTHAGQGRSLPEPDFPFLVTSLAMQVMMSLGEIASPVTGEAEVDLERAKHAIDTLGVLEHKTRGNLTQEEDKLLQATLYDLRVRYIAMSSSGAPPKTS